MTPRTLLLAAVLIAAALPAEAQSRPESTESHGAQVAVLLQKLDSGDPDVVTGAADAIFEIAPASDAPIPKLVALLESRDPEVRSSAAFALVPYGPRAAAALPSLAKMLREDRARHGGRGAALALIDIDRTGATAIPAICDLADGPLPGFFSEVPGWIKEAGVKNYRAAARPHGARLARLLAITRDYELADVLLNLALDPKDIVPVLAELLVKKPDALPHAAFVRADPAGAVAVPVLVRLVADPAAAVQGLAIEQLIPFGPKGKDAVPALLASFRDGGGAPRVRVLWALAVIGLPARSVAALAEDIRRESPADRAELLSPLTRLDPDGAVVVGLLAAQLAEFPFAARMTAADDLAWLGPKAVAAVPALLRALADTATDEAKARFIEALGAIGPGAAEARPVLLAQLGDVDSFLARSARWALGAIGGPLTPAEIAALAEKVRAASNPAEAIVSAQRIGLAGDAGKDALPALIGALAARSPQLRMAAAWAIGAIGPAAAAAVPDLMRVLEEAPAGVGNALSDYAVEALGRLGPAARQAAPLLAKRGSRHVVEAALRRIQPPLRNPLTIAVDPQLVLPVSGDADWKPSLAWKEPDGSYRIGIGSGGGLSGFYGGIFLSRDPDGRPVANCDLWFFTCVSSGCWGPRAITAGTLKLRSADLGSGKPIVGILSVTRIEGGEREDPFDPPLTFPFQAPDPFAAPTSRPR